MESHKNVLGGVFLIAGSCIGAAMLALPILSGITGYIPSVFLTLLTWSFMTFTALLLVEANGWFKGQTNIVSISKKALGNSGRVISWFLYLFLFYSLLVAYIISSGEIFSGFFYNFFNLFFNPQIVSLFFVLILGFVIYFGTRKVDILNRYLMVGLISTYLMMIFIGIFKINPDNLKTVNLKYLIFPLPILITSFGFHNMIPTLTAYLQGDLRKMRTTVLLGSTLALIIYLVWQTVVIGIIPYSGKEGLLSSFFKGQEATVALNYYLKSSFLGLIAQLFAFFAIITSFLAQGLGLMHFIADGLKVTPNKKNNLWLIFLAIIPPTFLSFTYPEIFFKALSFAGGFCAVILFGIFPALMVWVGRYKEKYTSNYHVKGGKITLLIIIFFSIFLAVNEILKTLGVNLIV
jgi:tyrosine-specific transport protein